MNVKFSLILATLNREKEIVQCLNSLAQQSYKNFEVIIVDQSNNEFTQRAVEKFTTLDILYYRVSFKGLSRSRNYALQHVSGDYVSLLDDDAIYDPEYLSEIIKNLDGDKTILSGYIWDLIYKRPYCAYGDIKNKDSLTTREIIRYCPSAGLTIPTQLFTEVGDFFDDFGVGATYQSSEESDLLLRGTKNGYVVKYIAEAVLKHPCGDNIVEESPAVKNLKKEKYAYGQGAFYRKKITYEKDYRVVPIFLERLLKLIAKGLIKCTTKNRNKEMIFFIKGFRAFNKKD